MVSIASAAGNREEAQFAEWIRKNTSGTAGGKWWLAKSDCPSKRYNPNVNTPAAIQPEDCDESLLDWFLSLDPGQRLAELESRVAFFNSALSREDPELSPDP